MKRINYAMRKAAAVSLAALVAASGMGISAVTVMADDEAVISTGQEQINNVSGQETTYKAYKIFTAELNEDGSLSYFEWPSNMIRGAVIKAIKAFDSSYISTKAQDAADFISKAYQDASGNITTDQSTILDHNELLNRIAMEVMKIDDYTTIVSGETVTLSEGYWLAITDGASIGIDEDGTSPVFSIVGGEKITITEKTTIPTVDKQILDDADGADWAYGADAEIDQIVQHKVTGTVANNIKTYSEYYYEFEDVMSEGIDYIEGSFAVTADGTDITSEFNESYEVQDDFTRKLRVYSSDLKGIEGETITGDTRLELTYSVKLNSKCKVGREGNPNDVRIIYSSNPNTSEKSATHTVRDYLYTYRLHVEKKDKETNVALEGAKFTIQVYEADDAASTGKYVQANGTLGSEAFEFTTDANGIINVSGLDVGTYILKETAAPEGYSWVNEDTYFTIDAEYAENGVITSLTNVVFQNSDAAAGIDTTDDKTVNGDEGSAVDLENGTVNVTVANIKKIRIPLSGQSGIMLITAAGIGIVGLSLAGFLGAGRRKETDKE